MTRTVADQMVETLAAAGVERIYGIVFRPEQGMVIRKRRENPFVPERSDFEAHRLRRVYDQRQIKLSLADGYQVISCQSLQNLNRTRIEQLLQSQLPSRSSSLAHL
jgi:hypothetical protein